MALAYGIARVFLTADLGVVLAAAQQISHRSINWRQVGIYHHILDP